MLFFSALKEREKKLTFAAATTAPQRCIRIRFEYVSAHVVLQSVHIAHLLWFDRQKHHITTIIERNAIDN